MAMTRKHFCKIAEILKSHKERIEPATFHWLCLDFADFCGTENENFNDSRFLDACALEPTMEQQSLERVQ
jgi:hypothetical protein